MDEGRNAAIRDRAYQIWQESGGGDGHDLEHWRQAEAEYGGAAKDAPDAGESRHQVPEPSGHQVPEPAGHQVPEPAGHRDGVSPLPPRGA